MRRVQSSEPLHTKMNPISCWDHGLYRILSSYSLSHFYLLKKSAKVHLYFGLACGLLVFFKYSTLQAIIPRTIVESLAFCSTVRRKRSRFVHIQAVIPTRRMIRGIFGFLCEAAQNFELFSNVQDQNSKIKKNIAVDVLFMD